MPNFFCEYMTIGEVSERLKIEAESHQGAYEIFYQKTAKKNLPVSVSKGILGSVQHFSDHVTKQSKENSDETGDTQLPKTLNCALCKNSLKLDETEQEKGVYFCPYCNREVDHRELVRLEEKTTKTGKEETFSYTNEKREQVNQIKNKVIQLGLANESNYSEIIYNMESKTFNEIRGEYKNITRADFSDRKDNHNNEWFNILVGIFVALIFLGVVMTGIVYFAGAVAPAFIKTYGLPAFLIIMLLIKIATSK